MGDLDLFVGNMSCRRSVREVSAWLRDIPGVETITVDLRSSTVRLSGAMDVADVIAAFAGTTYRARVVGAGR